MILILNGAFGVGKTTVADRVAASVAGAVVYDPERWGYVLQRLPPWMLRRATRVEDFQDLPQWRRLIARGAKAAHRRAGAVIVPMAFTNADYLTELVKALEPEGEVRSLCLVAPPKVIAQRLAERAARAGRAVSAFEHRRSKECVEVHANPVFGPFVDATRPVAEIADEIAVALRTSAVG